VAYELYERGLLRDLRPEQMPKHVGVIVDGNRRWARAFGAESPSGYRAGAGKIEEFLGWCDDLGVEVVTLWLLSTDNLGRPDSELQPLLGVIERLAGSLADVRRWRIHPVGALDLLPGTTAEQLKAAADRTSHLTAMTVNIAVGYGGRRELADAVRSLLHEHASKGTDDRRARRDSRRGAHRSAPLHRGQPDPDLVIRTSGEQRLSGFLLWQSVHSEFYFCEALWPDFRRVDFLRAIRAYAARERRFGT
jgi:short-chain Z-isoprenyl diphosphate synthase